MTVLLPRSRDEGVPGELVRPYALASRRLVVELTGEELDEISKLLGAGVRPAALCARFGLSPYQVLDAADMARQQSPASGQGRVAPLVQRGRHRVD